MARGIDGYLIDKTEEVPPVWLQGKQRIGGDRRRLCSRNPR
ncbi:MAG: hypothetical protein WAJ82_13045, partial [Azonexus sp.]